MDLTIAEAAQLLGKSHRQVRYLIKTGKLQARKRGGQWLIDRAELPLSDGQSRAAERKLVRAREVVEEALGAPQKAAVTTFGETGQHERNPPQCIPAMSPLRGRCFLARGFIPGTDGHNESGNTAAGHATSAVSQSSRSRHSGPGAV